MNGDLLVATGESRFGDAIVRWEDQRGAGWLRFREPARVVTASELESVPETIGTAENWARGGGWAVGYVSYEAGPAFDPALEVLRASEGPFALFLLYGRAPDWFAALEPQKYFEIEPEMGVSFQEYERAFLETREAIAFGAIYQLNFTFRQSIVLGQPALSAFSALCGVQAPPYATFIDAGDHKVVSLSPELFFERKGCHVTIKPMKGTAFPGSDPRVLSDCAKSRAENLMIVDMVRNDLGRVAKTGSVAVSELMAVEEHRTVLQMTSTVEAVCECSLPELFGAAFPPASVTGAPKVSACRHIARLETTPRGIYCGAIGLMAPNERARFSVGIRTAVVNNDCNGVYGVGSGLVWDSNLDSEWQECLLKAQVLRQPAEPFALIESCLVGADLQPHIERMRNSAQVFGIPFDDMAFVKSAESAEGRGCKLRILLAYDGSFRSEIVDSQIPDRSLRATLAAQAVWSGDWRLRHKTTERSVYSRALESGRQFDEVLLFNERDEATSFCRGNALFFLNGRWVTPSVECGCLAGVGVKSLILDREVEVGIVKVSDLSRCERIELVNSVVGCREVSLSSSPVKHLTTA